jgi:hypothetical protein
MRKSRESLMLHVTALCVDLLSFDFINSEILSSVILNTYHNNMATFPQNLMPNIPNNWTKYSFLFKMA